MQHLTPEILCALMLLVTAALCYTGFPIAFILAGTAFLFALLSLFLGFINFDLLYAMPNELYKVMTNEVLLAIPPLIFMALLLEKIDFTQNILSDHPTKLENKPAGSLMQTLNFAMVLAPTTGILTALFTGMRSNLNSEASGSIFAEETNLKMQQKNYDPNWSAANIDSSMSLSYLIAPSILLLLMGTQYLELANTSNNQSGLELKNLLSAALIPAIILYILFQLLHLSIHWNWSQIAPALSMASALPDEREETKEQTSNQWLHVAKFKAKVINVRNSKITPAIILAITILMLLISGMANIAEAASIGALAALLITASYYSPANTLLFILAAGCFILLLVLSTIFTFNLNLQQTDLIEAAALILSFALVATTVFGIYKAFKICFVQKDQEIVAPIRTVMQTTLLHASMIFILILSSSIFLMMLKALGGEAALLKMLQALPGNGGIAFVICLLLIAALGLFLPHLLIIILVVPLIAPQILNLKLIEGFENNALWISVMIIMTLKASYILKRSTKNTAVHTNDNWVENFKLKTEARVNQLRARAPYLTLHLLVMACLWFAPEIILWIT